MADETPAMFRDSRRQALGLAHDRERVEQEKQLERVSNRITGAISAFFVSRDGQEFHADDLRRHVAAHCGVVAPESSNRIMRKMRRDGDIAYKLINRSGSLYRAGQTREKATC